jgi:hypothetical protein
MPGFTRSDILEQLDACAERFCFPMLDNGYVYPVDVRLHAWRDDLHWAIAIEHLGYSPRAAQLDDCVYLFGNCLTRPPGSANEDFLTRIAEEDVGESEHAFPELGEVHIGDLVVALPPHDDPWPLYELFRSLVPLHRERLLATSDELTRRLRVPLPKLLQLEEWQHPDLCGDERPSASKTFQTLADALVAGDARLYRALEPNTHWSNWPDGGAL